MLQLHMLILALVVRLTHKKKQQPWNVIQLEGGLMKQFKTVHVSTSIEAYHVLNKKWFVTICGEYQTVDFRHCHVVAPFMCNAQSEQCNHIENVTLLNVHFVSIRHAFSCGFRLDVYVCVCV